jgi:hypothetical protein
MATFNSTQYAQTQASPVDPLDPTELEGRVRVAFADLPSSHGNTLAQNDLINLFDLPKGARPLWLMTVFGAFGTSVTLDVGYNGDENAFEDGLDISAAGTSFTAVDDFTVLSAKQTVQAALKDANPADNVGLTVIMGYAQA